MKSLTNWLATSGFLTMGRLVGAGAGFFTQILLARILSPRELGLFFACTSFAVVASILSTGGYPGVMQRFVTRYRERQKRALASAFIRYTQLTTVKTTALIAVILFVVSTVWVTTLDTRIAIIASVFSMIAMASLNIHIAIAVVERRFSLAILPDNLFRPILFLGVVVTIALTGTFLSAGGVAVIYAGLTGLVALVQFMLLAPGLAKPSADFGNRRLKNRWRREAAPLIVVALFTNLFADIAIFLATPFLALEDVAAFGICVKISMLVGFVVQVSQQLALPDLAIAKERGDEALSSQALVRASLFPSIVTLGATLLALAWGDILLGLFSPAFVSEKWSLVIMAGAQCIRAVAGPNALMLTLTGAHRMNSIVCLACSALLLLSNAVLIPTYGLEGAALSMAISYVAWVAATTVVLWRQGRVRSDLFVLAYSFKRPEVMSTTAPRKLGP